MPGVKSPTHRRHAANARKGKSRKKIPGVFEGGLEHLTNPEPPHSGETPEGEGETRPAPSNSADTAPSVQPGQSLGLKGKLPVIDLGKPTTDNQDTVPLEPDVVPTNDAKPVRLTREQRRVEALNYRASGYDYREIAQALGVSVKTVYYDVQDALTYLRKYERVLAEDVRALHMNRMSKMVSYLWPAVERGETYSIAQVMNIMAREAKMLGLDAPEQVDINIRRPLIEATTEELIALAHRLKEARPVPGAVLSTSQPLIIDGQVRKVELLDKADSAAQPEAFVHEDPPGPPGSD